MDAESPKLAQVIASANLRKTPGYLDKPADDVLLVLAPKNILPIIGGPTTVDGLTWWNLDYNGVLGWTAQVDPYGVVLLILAPAQGTTVDLEGLAAQYGIPVEVAEAILLVESGGRAFGADGRMIIRFENHIFDQYYPNQGMYDEHYRYGGPPWTGHQWRPDLTTWHLVHTGAQVSEWDCFDFARSVMQETSAMYSISMGAPQIMGFNHRSCGYATVQGMYNAFSTSYQAQAEGFFRYLESSGALAALQAGDYLRFATIYNGSGQAEYYAGLIEGQLKS